MTMSSRWTWACVLGCAGMAGLANTVVAADPAPADANPYSVISDRNIFHLNPQPKPEEVEAVKPADQHKLMLTGIIKKHDSMAVLLAILSKDNKEPPIYLSLAPGEKGHDVELIKVRYDKEEPLVDVNDAGTLETLTIKSNSYASAAPPAAHVGGAPAMPGGLPGLGHRPGFPARNALPMPGQPAADFAPRGGSAIIAGGGNGSAIISGGGGNAASTYSPYNGGALVSGGSPYVPTGAGVPGNNVGGQIANTLFNQQTGKYQVPVPTAPPAPPAVQAAGMLLHEAAGGPPAPPMPGEPPGPPGVP